MTKVSYTSFWGAKSVSLFEKEITETAAIFGRDYGITVDFDGGQSCEIRDRNISFPTMPPTLELSSDVMMFMRGIVDSKAASLRYSDVDEKNYIIDENKASKKQFLNEIFEAIEDVRVEDNYNALYPGAKKNLSEYSNELLSRHLRREAAKEDAVEYGHNWKTKETVDRPLMQNSPLALIVAGRKAMNYYSWRGTSFLREFSTKDADKIDCWVEDIFKCESTLDSYELAKKIYKELKDDNGGEGEGSGDPQPDPQTGIISNIFSSSGEEQKSKDISKIIKDETERSGSHSAWDNSDEVTTHHWSNYPRMKEHADLSYFLRIKENLSTTVNTARRKLELLLRAQRRVDWQFQKESGRLNSRVLCQAYQGDPFVFKLKKNAPDMDTSVSVLIDLSSSMGKCLNLQEMYVDGNITPITVRDVAFETALALFECFAKMGIPFEVSGYSSGQLLVFKAFKDKPFVAREYLVGLSHKNHKLGLIGHHGTPTGPAMMEALNRIIPRSEPRKIMFVLTDGSPDDAQKNNDAVEYAKKYGVETIGVGICCENVKYYFPKWVVCHKAQDLPKDMIKILTEILLKKKDRSQKEAA